MPASDAVLVTTWTKPDDDRDRRTGIWRVRLDGSSAPELIETGVDSVYWAVPEPDAATLLVLQNDREWSTMRRFAPHEAVGHRLSEAWTGGGLGGSYLNFHPDGHHFAVANARTGWAVFANGETPQEIAALRHSGSGPHPRQSGSHPHCALFSADGRRLLLADMGSDEVLAADFDAATGTVGAARVVFHAEPGTGPRHLVLSGDVVYLLGELGNTVHVLVAEDDGSLTARQRISTLPAGFSGQSHTAHIAIGPRRDRLYVTNRQHDSIAVFAIGSEGLLEPIAHVGSGGRWPWHFLFPDDQTMAVANNQSDELTLFDVDEDGLLTHRGGIHVPRPVFSVMEPAAGGGRTR